MLPLFTLEEYLLAHEHKAEISLCSSGPDSLTLAELLKLADPALLAQWESLSLGYSTPQGWPGLRQAIAQQYDTPSQEDVMVFSGACEAIYCAMQSLLTPQDHVIAVTPCYQSLKSVAASICEVTEAPLRFEQGWRFDPESIQAQLRPNTRMIVINFPNNPTGALPELAAMQRLVEIARNQGAWIFSDEVYRLMELDTTTRLPALCDLYEKGLSVSSLSKAYGLPGLRMGWLATRDKTVVSRLLSTRHYLTICNDTPSERLTVMALQARDKIIERHMRNTRENLKRLTAFMADYSDWLTWVPPQAGCLAFPKLRQNKDADRVALEVLNQEKTLVLPGSLYDAPPGHLRLGFGSQTLPEALTRLARFLQKGRSSN